MTLDPVEAWCRLLYQQTCSAMSPLDVLGAGATAAFTAAALVQGGLILHRSWCQFRALDGRKPTSPLKGPLRGLDVSESLPDVDRRRTPRDVATRSPYVLR